MWFTLYMNLQDVYISKLLLYENRIMYLTGQPRGVTPYPFESWNGVVPYEYI